MDVPNVHVNENNLKTYIFEVFFSSSEKLTFEKENVVFEIVF